MIIEKVDADNSDFVFNAKESSVVAFAVNRQGTPYLTSLGDYAINAAKSVQNAWGEKLRISHENTSLFYHNAASQQRQHDCTKANIETAIIENGDKVGDNGIFFIHFTCHGVKVDGKFCLAPQDYNLSKRIFIEASDLKLWLKRAGCQEKRVILSLDCCNADGISKELITENIQNQWVPHYIIAACPQNEETIADRILDGTLFSSCLKFAIQHVMDTTFPIIIKSVFEKMVKIVEAIMSLHFYSKLEGGTLQYKKVIPKPKLRQGRISQGGIDPSSVCRAPAAILNEEQQLPVHLVSLCDECIEWLTGDANKALIALKQEGVLGGDIHFNTLILCGMLYSTASIQLKRSFDDSTAPTLDEKLRQAASAVDNDDLYFTAFTRVTHTINSAMFSGADILEGLINFEQSLGMAEVTNMPQLISCETYLKTTAWPTIMERLAQALPGH